MEIASLIIFGITIIALSVIWTRAITKISENFKKEPQVVEKEIAQPIENTPKKNYDEIVDKLMEKFVENELKKQEVVTEQMDKKIPPHEMTPRELAVWKIQMGNYLPDEEEQLRRDLGIDFKMSDPSI